MYFPQLIAYFKIRSPVLRHKISSPQIFQSLAFSRETTLFLGGPLLLVSHEGEGLFVHGCGPLYRPLITAC